MAETPKHIRETLDAVAEQTTMPSKAAVLVEGIFREMVDVSRKKFEKYKDVPEAMRQVLDRSLHGDNQLSDPAKLVIANLLREAHNTIPRKLHDNIERVHKDYLDAVDQIAVALNK